MSEKKPGIVTPLNKRMTEPLAIGGKARYAERGVRAIQQPRHDGFLDDLSLAAQARIRDDIGIRWQENGRVAVADNGDLLVGIVVRNGSGKSQVLVRIESEEVFAHLAEMRAKAASPEPENDPSPD